MKGAVIWAINRYVWGNHHRISDGLGTPLNPRFWKWARGATGDPRSHTERDSQRLKASLNAAQPRKKKTPPARYCAAQNKE